MYVCKDHQGVHLIDCNIHIHHGAREDASGCPEGRLPRTSTPPQPLQTQLFHPCTALSNTLPTQVEVEDRPCPTLKHPTDAILKVTSTALCGSDLHFYRGHLKCPPNFICGHEFVGEIVEKGDSVSQFNIGDKVVVPFYTACGECYYCVRGQASRCSKGELFGNSAPANTIDGGQAEYVRTPLADTTLVAAPKDIPEEMLVLMADIFPTGYFAAARFLKDLPERDRKEFTAVVIGCGPVGICATVCALTMCDNVVCIDSAEDRLKETERLGAKTINLKDRYVDLCGV